MRLGHFPFTRTRRQAAGQARTNFLLRALAGVSTPNLGGDPFSGFQAGLAGALNQGTQAEAAAQAERDAQLQRDLQERLFGLQERGVAADELRAQADKERAAKEANPYVSPYDQATQKFNAELDFLTKHPGARALGVAGKRDESQTATQGEEDVNAIAAHYGVSPETARVLKVSGATRIRPKQVVTDYVDPKTGKPAQRITTINEPVQLITEREANSVIDHSNDPVTLQKMANGDMPDEIPDDPGLHQRLAVKAKLRLQAISADSGSMRIRGD